MKKRKRRESRARKRSAPKRADTSGQPKKARLSTTSQSDTTSTSSNSGSSSDRAGPSTRRKIAEGGDHDIDHNQCRVCFRAYEEDLNVETGLEWVECACQRWLHKECIDYET